jgi:hypothetical protein
MQPVIPAEPEKKQMALMATHQWPQECLSLAERFLDFPLREDFFQRNLLTRRAGSRRHAHRLDEYLDRCDGLRAHAAPGQRGARRPGRLSARDSSGEAA